MKNIGLQLLWLKIFFYIQYDKQKTFWLNSIHVYFSLLSFFLFINERFVCFTGRITCKFDDRFQKFIRESSCDLLTSLLHPEFFETGSNDNIATAGFLVGELSRTYTFGEAWKKYLGNLFYNSKGGEGRRNSVQIVIKEG